MSVPRNTWFWSDQHFGHKNIISLCDRPFGNLDEMHSGLVENFHTTVRRGDTVIWVGDVFFKCPGSEAEKIMDLLDGCIHVCVVGNHDVSEAQLVRWGFHFTCHSLTLEIAKQKVTVSHYPLRTYAEGESYIERRIDDVGQFHIHGHTHSKERFRDRQIHVGVDAWGFKPVSISEIESYLKKHSEGKL